MKMEEKDFEPAGLIPRSIIRTVERFQQQLRPETVALGIQEFRISRYQVRVSVRYFFILLLLPLSLNWGTKNLIIKPLVGYFWNTNRTSLFLNSYQAERAFQEMRDFESQLFFEMLLSNPKNLSNTKSIVSEKDFSLKNLEVSILGQRHLPQVLHEQRPRSHVPTNSGVYKDSPRQLYPKGYLAETDAATLHLVKPPSRAGYIPFLSFPRSDSRERKTIDSRETRISLKDVPTYSEGFEKSQVEWSSLGVLPCPFASHVGRALRSTEGHPSTMVGQENRLEFRNYPPLPKVVAPQPTRVDLSYHGLGQEGRKEGHGKQLPTNQLLTKGGLEFDDKQGIEALGQEHRPIGYPLDLWDRCPDLQGSLSVLGREEAETIALVNNVNLPYYYPSLGDRYYSDTNLSAALFQKKTVLLAEIYNQQSITALSNMFGDCVMVVSTALLLRWNAPQFTILKSFLIESFYSFNDAIKCFYIILITDFLVGFHSPRGWEIAMEMLLRHLGLPEDEEFILLFVGTFPVFLDTAFKYWIFRYLNKISPSTVATYHSMIE